jgi:nitroreductase
MSNLRIYFFLGQLKFQVNLVFNFYKEAKTFFLLLIKHNASISTNKSKGKMQYTLLRENHVIEKGMSMKNPRIGFGQEKVMALLTKLDLYYYSYQDKAFLSYPLSTIKSYIELTNQNKIEIPLIEKKFNELCEKSTTCEFQKSAGIKEVSKFKIWEKSKINFFDFVNCRHSIRYFSDELPDLKLIKEALKIAQRTPSACNRQAWKAYIFSNEKTYDLLKWQGGANGFEKEIPLSILVTSNLNAFLSYEPHQAYVDGGMYAMSLIYALHSLGLGTIPLSMGFKAKKIEEIHQLFKIPENEIPIVIIGVGHLLEHFTVAASKRKSVNHTSVFNIN